MSIALYAVSLQWAGGRGVVKFWEHTILIDKPPIILGEPVHEVNYTPEIRVRYIRRRACDTRDDMSDAEVADALRLIKEMTCGAP